MTLNVGIVRTVYGCAMPLLGNTLSVSLVSTTVLLGSTSARSERPGWMREPGTLTFHDRRRSPSLMVVVTEPVAAGIVYVCTNTPLLYNLTRTSGVARFGLDAFTKTRATPARPVTSGTFP